MNTPRLLPYALIAPAVVFLAAFFLLPLAQTIALSFQSGDGIGLDNYARMAGDLNFTLALRNTFLLVITVVPIQVALAWILGKPGVTTPIISATKLEQLDQLIDGMSVTLLPEEIASLEAPYVPHGIIGHDE